ncbi:MAG: allophanate hydrolase [Hyphomicrobium sp.]
MTYSLDIASLAKRYADGTLTPVDVVDEVYRRIAADGQRPIWISVLSQSEALAKAKKAPRGPLFGIPFAVKDNIDVAGLPTTCACPEYAYTPEASAHAVALLEAAGAIPIGKTNLDQFATGLNGTRTPYGVPASPFDDAYISGGSSSGSAVAVAKGLVSFALGTDTAGSGRVPAAFNNIVGLKPSKGLISTRGVTPACRTQDVVSIFALTAADAHAAFSVAAAFDSLDPFARKPGEPIAVQTFAKGVRIGVPAGPLEFFGDRECEELYLAAIRRLEKIGARMVEIDLTPFKEAAQLLYAGPWVAERLAAIRRFVHENALALEPTVRDIVLGAREVSAVSAFEGIYKLAELIREAEREWEKMDVLLLPTAPTTYRIVDMLADPLRLNSNLGLYTNFVNLMDLSALAVPAGFGANRLPFGVTLIGRAFEDGRLATLGDALHRSLDAATLGATATLLSATLPIASAPRSPIEIAVVGAHLTGQPLNGQLTERNARLVRTAWTGPGYSLYVLANTTPPKPGLIFDGAGAGRIEVEVWEMSAAAFGAFVALIPPPLGIGTIALADGSSVKGFLCEAHALSSAEDITSFGGWRAWLARRMRD